jgi:uncharacterized coiled-coil protein SlyX
MNRLAILGTVTLAVAFGSAIQVVAYDLRTDQNAALGALNNQHIIVCRQPVDVRYPCGDILSLDTMLAEDRAPLEKEVTELKAALVQERKNNDQLAKAVDALTARVQSLEEVVSVFRTGV